MSLRIGLATGEVLSGGPRGSGASVIGDALSVATRLATAAHPGEVLLGEATYSLVRHVAETQPAGSVPVRGWSRPLTVHRLTSVPAGISGHQLRLDSPLVGRERELRQLEAAFERTVEEQACTLFSVLGPAGAGKSRLVHEFLGSVRSEAAVVRGRCLPYGERVAFWPVVEAIRQAAMVSDADPLESLRHNVETVLQSDPRAALIADRVVGVIGGSATPSTAEETSWALRRCFEHLARQRPLVMVFDDIQWGEPAFLDLVEHVAAASRGAPILLLCIARPELLDERPGWGGGTLNATTVLLGPLAEVEVSRLVTNLLGGSRASQPIERKIAEAAEGNPLFVEEFLAMLLDDGHIRRSGDNWIATTDLGAIATPGSIMTLLAARLDRLPADERDVIERAAVVGKVFTQESVAALAEADARSDVGRCLTSLVNKELIRPDLLAADEAESYRSNTSSSEMRPTRGSRRASGPFSTNVWRTGSRDHRRANPTSPTR